MYSGGRTDEGSGALNFNSLYTLDNKVAGSVTAVTDASYTVLTTDRTLLVDTSSNAVTIDLQGAGAAGNGRKLDIKCVDATNTITVDGSSSQTIDGSLTQTITTLYDNMSLVCDGSNWHIL
jgi:hypothetical protein